MIGQRFGKLVVVAKAAERPGSKGRYYWSCACDCGSAKDVGRAELIKGDTKSCGCINPRHGMSHSSTHKSWTAMIQRCTNPKREAFPYYGGRGITVCERWATSFAAFFADVGERPPGTSLDRYPDPDGNYEPGNVRWATSLEQALNSRVTKLTEDTVNEIRGRHEHGEATRSIARRLGLTPSNVRAIIQRKTWRHIP